jgi:hypothetical protein
MKKLLLAGGVPVLVALACGGGGSSRFPSRPDGCQVQVFREAPNVKTENIGPVWARCEDIVSKDACLRELLDQVCKLGGDVVWGVNPEPEQENDHWKYAGRAAHTN